MTKAAKAKGKSKFIRLLTKVGPIVISAGILFYIFYKVDFAKVGYAIKTGENLIFFPMALGYFIITYLLECGGLYFIYNWSGAPSTYKEMLPVRGATYLLSMINYNVGLGGIVYYIHKKKKIPVMDALSTLLFMSGWDFYIMVFMCSYGLFGYGLEQQGLAGLRIFCLVIMATLVPYIFFVFQPISRLTGRNLTPRWLQKIRDWKLLSFIKWASVKRHVQLIAIRLPIHLFLVLGHWAALRCYHVEVPFVAAMAFIPVIILIGVIPITFHGWGAIQAAAIALFSQWGTAADILAYSVMMGLTFHVIQVVLGLGFLKKAYHDVMPPKNGVEDEAKAEETAESPKAGA